MFLAGNNIFGMAVDELRRYIYYGDHGGIMQGDVFSTSKTLVVKNAGKSSAT